MAAVSAAAASLPPSKTPSRRTRRRCSRPGCQKVDAGGGCCVAHGGGKKCSFPGCTKGYQTGGFCRRHGGGARCQVEGCGKVDAGKGLCRAHGGGKRCQIEGCPKADVGGGYCTFHGGGKRCSEPGCSKIDQGGGKCRAHGGARRCRRRNCLQPARGATGFCTDHGGARVCSVLSCRRLVRLPATGTICATCAKSQTTAESSSLGGLSPFSPMSTTSARCDGSQIANCLENGCARSFGSDCNCVEDCTCNSPTSLSSSREAPVITSSSLITSTAGTTSQATTTTCSEFQDLLQSSKPSALLQTMIRVVLQIKPQTNSLGMEAITALLATISGVRSVHVLSDGQTGDKVSEKASPQLVVVRGEKILDLEKSLAPLRSLQIAQMSVLEQGGISWTRKEVVLRIPEMMCPGNCGSSVLNAVRVIDGVEAAKLRFESRQVVVRGDMNVGALRVAVNAIGFGVEVDAETPLPRRFRFRVDDLSDEGFNGLLLKSALNAVEGVENLVLLTDRAEVLVVATLLQSDAIVDAAARVGFEMLELSEEAWGIPMEVIQPPLGSSNPRDTSTSGSEDRQSHQCDLNICPQNGCPRYMTTVAHTAALAVGWAVPGCGMSVGGECTCGDGCKCDGCPEHNPTS